jgi:hypothetical protein
VPSLLDQADARRRDRLAQQRRSRAFTLASASASATKPPVTDAVRVPPSASSTSQSIEIVRSRAIESTAARSARPTRRWISCVRPLGALPRPSRVLAPRGFARGCIWYSAGDPALVLAFEERRHLSSTDAVQRTTVPPRGRGPSPRTGGGSRGSSRRAESVERATIGAGHGVRAAF